MEESISTWRNFRKNKSAREFRGRIDIDISKNIGKMKKRWVMVLVVLLVVLSSRR